MKAASIPNKPRFKLMTQTDIQSFYHMQMPRWLFFDPKYTPLPLEAKVAYTFLLNRFQLSKLNGWVNGDGEVFIIYTRESLAAEMQISYRKAIESMKALAAAKLIWERRCGRGDANQIYLAKVELTDEAAFIYESAPFVSPGGEQAPKAAAESTDAPPRPAESALLDGPQNPPVIESGDTHALLRPAETALQEVPISHIQTCENGSFRPADFAALDLPDPHISNKDLKEIQKRDIESQSVGLTPAPAGFDRRTDDDEIEELNAILERCNLWIFEPETAKVFENAIERLFFTEKYKIGGAVLPQRKVRSRLWELDEMKLRDAEHKIADNTEHDIRNTTAYTMAVIFNSICELESDLLHDPYLNSLKSRRPPERKNSGGWD